MLHKFHNSKLIESKQASVKITDIGRKIGMQMIRNTRLLGVMMKDQLKIEIDEEMACGIEHHMKNTFTDALCSLLKHPRKCPQGHNIPRGKFPCVSCDAIVVVVVLVGYVSIVVLIHLSSLLRPWHE
jgi:DtxR family Mn-dependent transcriptional regulator